MKSFILLVLLSAAVVWAQAPPSGVPPLLPNLSDTAQIAVFDDGTVLTAGQLRGYLTVLDPSKQAIAAQSPETLIQEIAFMRKLAGMAEKEKLDQQSPAREQLVFNRLLFLTQIKAGDALAQTQVDPKEILDYYNANKNKYKQVKVNAIYIAFGEVSGSRKSLSEGDARAKKSRELQMQLRAGDDFAKLAKENSDDRNLPRKERDISPR